MANEWEVLEDKRKHDKRWVKIHDTVNKISYGEYFPLKTADNAIIARFKKHVKTRRAEIASKQSTLDLSNFENGL